MRAEWLNGWDPTPGIVSVWAEPDGRASVWRRGDGALTREDVRFRPWLVLAHASDAAGLAVRELAGEGELRFLARADDLGALTQVVLRNAGKRLGHAVTHVRELGDDALALPPDEQYLVATGRAYFRDLEFDDLHRMQIDLETTGLDPQCDRIFLIAVRDRERVTLLEDADEAALIRRLVELVRASDPDVIENHNLHGFDIPFLVKRAERLGVSLALGRAGALRQRAARRGVAVAGGERKIRFVAPGRELVDTLDLVLRGGDFAHHGKGLKAIARALGVAAEDREYIPGDRVHDVYRSDPDRVRRYASADVDEVAQVAKLLGGAAFALATMVPRRYERLVDAGAATGVLDPLLVRAYLRAGAALPAHATSDGTPHSGAALHLFNAGVATRVIKADVASLYPSLMRHHRIGPARDRLGALLALVDGLVERRLAAKAAAKAAASNSRERYAHEAMSSAMKLVVNSAYGYLAAPGLTRFADVHAANEVTRHGRDVLALLCKELAARGITLLEADTDGVYGAVPESWTEVDERRAVAEVAALLPPLVQLEFEGRYAAMLSHEPKNYALLGYDGALHLRGVAFRSSRAEPFGEAFLRDAIGKLLVGDIAAMQRVYIDAIAALRARRVTTFDVASRVKLTKTPAEYAQTRESRRELSYEAMLAAGRTTWSAGDRVHVYRAVAERSGVLAERSDVPDLDDDRRDYDIEHYVRVLHDTYASRLARAFEPDDFAALFDDPDQLLLFAKPVSTIRPILRAIDATTDGSRNGE
ncbi:MAG TPA: DNA polymerase domain-containing protein [Kofleriaceae bacterium]|nr:DNA polymerase domain-containing protein [Kofleriaceae bacterium]